MNPTRFLRIIGPVLIVAGLLGVTGVLGRLSPAAFFHPPSWINWFHTAFGCFVLASSFSRSDRYKKSLATGAAAAGLTLGAAGLALGDLAAARFGMPELADRSDHIAHLMVGVLAAWGLGGTLAKRDVTGIKKAAA